MAAIEAGKQVLIEKPLASSYAEGRALVNAADERGVVLMCDHTYCYTPAVRRIRELVHSGVLGELQFVDSVRINLGLVQRDVDVLWDLAPHDLSILDFILPAGLHAACGGSARSRPDRSGTGMRRLPDAPAARVARSLTSTSTGSVRSRYAQRRSVDPTGRWCGTTSTPHNACRSTTGVSTSPTRQSSTPTIAARQWSPTAPGTWSLRRCPRRRRFRA